MFNLTYFGKKKKKRKRIEPPAAYDISEYRKNKRF